MLGAVIKTAAPSPKVLKKMNEKQACSGTLSNLFLDSILRTFYDNMNIILSYNICGSHGGNSL